MNAVKTYVIFTNRNNGNGGRIMKYLLKNGTVISGTGGKKLDVLVEGEKIIRVGESLF